MSRNETVSPLLPKARAFSELIRLDLVIGAGMVAVAGEILAPGELPPCGGHRSRRPLTG